MDSMFAFQRYFWPIVLPFVLTIISMVNLYVFFYKNGYFIIRLPLIKYFQICNQNDEFPIWGLLYIASVLITGINFGIEALIKFETKMMILFVFILPIELFIMSLFVIKYIKSKKEAKFPKVFIVNREPRTCSNCHTEVTTFDKICPKCLHHL
jgi:hypothetical protein